MRHVGKAKVSLELVDTAPLAGRHVHVPTIRVDVGAGRGSGPLALHSPRHTYTHTPTMSKAYLTILSTSIVSFTGVVQS
jgi:hypothetical protein